MGSESTWTAVLAVLAGLGLSVWLGYLDYLRRAPRETAGRPSRPRDRLLDTGLGLVALGLLLDRITGARGWGAIACCLPVVAGIILVAAHVTRLLSSASGDGGASPDRKG